MAKGWCKLSLLSLDVVKFRFYDFGMIKSVTVSEAARGFADLINRVHYRNESALLTKGGKPVAKIVPVETGAKTGAELAELWPTFAHLSPTAADAFSEDVKRARTGLPKVKDKWE
jgi:prevent-host-death family protein